MVDLKPSQVSEVLDLLIHAQAPVVLWGPPGAGKSQMVHQAAERASMEVRDVRAVLLDPVDLRGLPHVEEIDGERVATWARPSFLPQSGRGILFLDELNRAPALVQNGCFQLILDRRLGDHKLGDGWTVISACNRETDGGGVTRMPSALANRFTHINVEPDLGDWCVWAAQHDISPMVIAFLRFRPNLLHVFDKNEHAYPTPRSWEFVSRIVKSGPQKSIELALVEGTVGHGAAVEFLAFVQLWRNLPNIDSILLNPSSAPLPLKHDTGTLYAVSAALASRATEENFGRVLTYLQRLPTEYQVFSVQDATRRDGNLASTEAFTNWAVANQDVF